MAVLFGVLVESSVRALIIAIAVMSALLTLRVRSPKVRHRAWTAVLSSMLLLPAISFWAPRLSVPLLPPRPYVARTIPNLPPLAFRVSDVSAAAAPPALPASQEQSGDQTRLYEIAMVLYAGGLCVLLARLLVGMALAFRLSLGASRTGSIGHSAQCRIPLTVGLFRPHVLLPMECKNWESAKLDAALAHEQEHVRRRDPLVEWIAMLNRCVYWFHPLAWWLRRKLAALAEQACDEAVLARGHEPGSYAELLVELARSAQRSGTMIAVWGSPMDGSALAVRIRHILTARRNPELSRARAAVVTVLCTSAILVSSFVTLGRAHALLHDSMAFQAGPDPTIGAQAGQSEADAAFRSDGAARVTESENRSIPSDSTLVQIASVPRQRKPPKEGNATPGDSIQDNRGQMNQSAGSEQLLTQPKAQDAELKIISILMRQMNSAGDERKELERALAEIQRFLTQFPNSEYAPQLTQWLGVINEKIREQQVIEARPEPYKKWLEEDVLYIIAKVERSAFLSLATNEEREKFIEQFWARRNSDPSGSNNPVKTEHYRRLAYANAHFASGVPGWKTDRGRIYVTYGEPDGKEAHPSGGSYQREFWQGGGETKVYPFERWRYANLTGIGPAEFEFVDWHMDGNYTLVLAPQSASEPLRASALILAEVVRIAGYFRGGGGVSDVESSAVPRPSSEYSNGESLVPYLQLFNAAIDPATNKPNLLISYTIMSGSQPVKDIEDSAGQTYHLVGDRVIVHGSIPLRDLQPGGYSLHVKVLDRLANRSIESSADFTVIR